jgi:hypothetical protein
MEKTPVFKRQELVKVSKLAARWQRSRQHIHNLISRGELLAFCFGGKRGMCIPLVEIERYEKNCLVDPNK